MSVVRVGRAVLAVLLLSLAGCDVVSALYPEPKPPPTAQGLAITPEALTLEVGASEQLSAAAVLSDGTRRPIPADEVTWRSLDGAVAGVSVSGIVEARKGGSTTIEATVEGLEPAQVAVTVNPAPQDVITLTPDDVTLPIGRQQTLTATLTRPDGTSEDITATAVWTSSEPGRVTVDQGVVRAIAPGLAQITARYDGVTSAPATVDATDAALEDVTVTPGMVEVFPGQTAQLTVTAGWSDGTTTDVTASAAWTSGDPGVATVANGVLVAVGVGQTEITATFNGMVSGPVAVSVAEAVPQALVVSPGTLTLPLGTRADLTAQLVYTDGSKVDVTSLAVWASDDEGIATVDASGSVSAVGQGATTVTASHGGFTAPTVQVTVTAPAVTAVVLSPLTANIGLGQTQAFTADALYTDGTTADVTATASYVSSDPAVLTLAGNVATGVAQGTAQVLATFDGKNSLSATVTVGPPVLTALTVSPGTATVPKSGTVAFTAEGTYSDGSTQDLTTTVTWTSSDPAIATIDAAGLATGVLPGTVEISANFGSQTSPPAVLEVLPPPITSVAISPVDPYVGRTQTVQLTATATYFDGSSGDVSATATWTTADPAIATVDAMGVVTGVGAGSVVITATAGSHGASTTVTVFPGAVTSVAVTPNAALLPVGVKAQLAARVFFDDGGFGDVTDIVAWSSSAPSVVTVGTSAPSAGLVTGVSTGSGTVSASLNGFTGAAVVTVNAATLTAIQVLPANDVLPVGQVLPYAAVGEYSDGQIYDLTLSAAWSSTDPAVATITDQLPNPGVVTALSVGMTQIEATHDGQTGSATLTTSAATLMSLDVSPPSSTTNIGLTVPFTATGHYSDGTSRPVGALATWTSSDPAVATVSDANGSSGVATGIGAGTATITADWGGQSGTATLTVTGPALQSISLTPSAPQIGIDAVVGFQATAHFSDGTTSDVTELAVWASSNPTVLSVGADGTALGVSPGSAIVTAQFGTKAGSAPVTITAATLQEVYITPAVATIGLGFSQQFSASGVWTDGTTADLTALATWTSSDPAIAAFSTVPGSEGRAQGLSGGTVTISALYAGVGDAVQLTVIDSPLVSIDVTPAGLTMPMGAKVQYQAVGSFGTGHTQDLTTQVTWASSDPAVASISAGGLAETLSAGATTISATAAGVTGSTPLTVTSVALTGVTLTPATLSVPVGTWVQLQAHAHYSDGTQVDVTAQASWVSSDPSIAPVSAASGSAGRVTGLTPGTATVTATWAGFPASTPVTVTGATLVSLSISPQNPTAPVGVLTQFTATGHYSDGTTIDLTEQVAWKTAPRHRGSVSNADGSRGQAVMLQSGTFTNVKCQLGMVDAGTKLFSF